MNKVVLIAIALLVFLAACKGGQVDATPLKTPVAAPVEAPAPAPETEAAPAAEASSGKTAAEALQELEQQMVASGATGPKQATTLYPPAPTGVTGKEALKARTRSLYSQGTGVSQITGGVITEFPDYSKSSSLPEGYGDDSSAGE